MNFSSAGPLVGRGYDAEGEKKPNWSCVELTKRFNETKERTWMILEVYISRAVFFFIISNFPFTHVSVATRHLSGPYTPLVFSCQSRNNYLTSPWGNSTRGLNISRSHKRRLLNSEVLFFFLQPALLSVRPVRWPVFISKAPSNCRLNKYFLSG